MWKPQMCKKGISSSLQIFYSRSSSDSETSDVEDTSYNNYSARIGGPCAVSREQNLKLVYTHVHVEIVPVK
jgi:hypothetical protein